MAKHEIIISDDTPQSRGGTTVRPSSQKRKFPYLLTVSLLFIFASGAWLRALLPLPPFSDHDTWGFLFPSLNRITNGVFCHCLGREFPYPFFVDRVLAVFGTLNALSSLQHLLGLLTGGILWMTWMRMARFFPDTPRLRFLHRWVGVAMLASYLLSVGPVRMEHSIRPEAIFPLVAVLTLFCGTRFTIAFYLDNNLRVALLWGSGLVALALSILFIKGAFGLGALAAMAPALISCVQSKATWKYRIAVLGLPVLLIGACLWYPEHRLSQRDDPLAKTFAHQHLFAFQARIIREEIGEELDGRHPLAYERELVETTARLMDEVLYAPSEHFPSLGFDADVLIYGHSVIEYLKTPFQGDGERMRQFYMHYYWSAWRHHPLEMLAKVNHQMVVFYSSKSPFDDRDCPISISREAYRSLAAMPALGRPLPLLDQYLTREQQLSYSPQEWRQPWGILWLNHVFALLYKLCAVGVMVVIGCLGWTRGRPLMQAAPWSKTAWWFLYVMGYGFFNTLTLAIGHTLDVRRYVQNQLVFSLLAVGCGVMLLGVLVQRVWGRQSRSKTSAPPSELPAGLL